ncbi:Hypothetical predicted protein [Pelobates cultripes]|uniref:Uncharacterized protein n=1 Tax=Pelobates cultripes TaxID=61616 RepID=A0AAD1SLR9_PELCU|nr:Hypothetical predicted protein [Pelobates cultripes]
MASKKERNTAGNTHATNPVPSTFSLQRFFSEQKEPERRSKMAPQARARGSPPSSPSASECSTEDTDLRSLLTQLPSKTDFVAMFKRLEESFSEKLQVVSSEVQQLGARVQALEDDGEAAEQ